MKQKKLKLAPPIKCFILFSFLYFKKRLIVGSCVTALVVVVVVVVVVVGVMVEAKNVKYLKFI
jgi:ABC-type lipoprotein release transport system permease subunit